LIEPIPIGGNSLMHCEPAYHFPAFATGWHVAVAEQEINPTFAE
jgi:hypothetical protein